MSTKSQKILTVNSLRERLDFLAACGHGNKNIIVMKYNPEEDTTEQYFATEVLLNGDDIAITDITIT